MDMINIGRGRGRFGRQQDPEFKPSLYHQTHQDDLAHQPIRDMKMGNIGRGRGRFGRQQDPEFISLYQKHQDKFVQQRIMEAKDVKVENLKINYLADDCQDYFDNNGNCHEGLKCTKRHAEIALGSTLQCIGWSNGVCRLGSSCVYRHARDTSEPKKKPEELVKIDENHLSEAKMRTQMLISALKTGNCSKNGQVNANYVYRSIALDQGQDIKTSMTSSTSIWNRSNNSQVQTQAKGYGSWQWSSRSKADSDQNLPLF